MRKLLVFPFRYKNKTESLLSESIKGFPTSILYVSPHMSKVRDFKMRYCKFFPDRCLLPTTRTLRTLALELLDRHSRKRVISEVEKYVILLQILKEKDTGRFRHTLPGTALSISHFIKDVKISTPEKSTPEKISFESIKSRVREYGWRFNYNLELLLFAIEVMEEYESLLKKENLMDMEDIYSGSAGYLSEARFNEVIFEGFSEIPPYQQGFISRLIEETRDVYFSFSYDEGAPVDVRELILEKSLSWLKSACGWEEKRFRSDEKKEKIECYGFSSESEEVKGIAKLIQRYVVSNPEVRLNDIMAVFPSMPSYRPIVERIFRRYRIPCEILPGYSLSKNSSVSVLYELFAFPGSYDWDILMNILMSPHLHSIDLRESEKFSESSRNNLARTGFLKDNFLSAKGKNFSIVKSVLKKIWSRPRSLRLWVRDVEAFIEKLGWQPGVPDVKVCFEKVMHEMSKESVFFTAEEFVNIMNKTLELVEVDKGKGAGVKVSGVQESVGLEKRLCIIGGATEDNLPSAPSLEEVFIPDKLKKQLGFADYNLRIARERLDLYHLKNENETVIFTYPSKVEGENRMKSIFLFGYEESIIKEEEFVSVDKNLFNFQFSMDMFRDKFVVDGKMNISVTQMEVLMKCPYRFYLRYVENLKTYQPPEIDEAPDLWGTIIHNVMKKIFSGYKGKLLVQSDIVFLEKAFKEELRKGIQQLFMERTIASLYRDVLLLRSEEVCEKFVSIIEKHQGYTFIDAEYKLSVELPSLRLRGKIDRIEKMRSGEISIIDIKTGTSAPPSYTEKDFFGKHNMQVPLYVWMYGKKFNTTAVSGSIWCFNFLEKEAGENEKIYGGKKLNYLTKIEDFLEQYAAEILKGQDIFNLENQIAKFLPDKSSCFTCQYRGVCPYEKT